MAKPVKKPPVKAVKDFAFDKGDFVVYPTHGVGKVVDIEAKEIAGHKLERLLALNGVDDAAEFARRMSVKIVEP